MCVQYDRTTRLRECPHHELLTVKEVAHWLRVHPATVRRWILRGALPARKIGHWRITRAAVTITFKLPV